jgi:hypothetical protein
MERLRDDYGYIIVVNIPVTDTVCLGVDALITKGLLRPVPAQGPGHFVALMRLRNSVSSASGTFTWKGWMAALSDA